MDDRDANAFVGISCLAALIFIVCLVGMKIHSLGYDRGVERTRQEAVSQRVAEWTADESGKPVFTWKGGE